MNISRDTLRGYILEEVLAFLIRDTGYRLLVDDQQDQKELGWRHNGLVVKGRGAIHQVDVLGELLWIPAFTYPLRLFVEAKFRGNRTGIGEVRNMIATLLDVNQNNMPQVNREAGTVPQLHPKYYYAGAIFSTSGFSGPAMDMALAHNVSLIELNAPEFQPLLSAITATADAIVASFAPDPNQQNSEEINEDEMSPVELASDRPRESRSRFLFALRTALRRTLETQTAEDQEERKGIRGLVSEMVPRLEVATSAARQVGQLFVGMGNGPYMLVLKADQPERFLRYARHRPVHEVKISWSSEQDYGRTWQISPIQNTGNESHYFLTFRVPKPIYDWIFAADNVRRAAIHAKNLYFSNIFIFHRDDDRDLLIRLKFNLHDIPR